MIYINHDKKALFLHIPKTAGSYVAKQLVEFYGFTIYKDILHKKRPDHDLVCKTSQFKHPSIPVKPYDNKFFNKLLGILVYCRTSDHINRMCNMDEEKWNSYTKFCFIRNPYDRAISAWSHINLNFKTGIPFNAYLAQDPTIVSDIEYGHIFMSQKRHMQNTDGTCGVDLIGRFEYLEEDFINILKTLGFDEIKHTPKKINFTKKYSDGKITLNLDAIRKINKLFPDDLNSFHYKTIDRSFLQIQNKL
jgi:hypothetical protein